MVPDTDLVITDSLQLRATEPTDGLLGEKAWGIISACGTKQTIDDIHVYYVHGILSSTGSGSLGFTIREQDNSNGYANNCFIQDVRAPFKTLANELVHLLTNEGHWGQEYGTNVTPTRREHNLMRLTPNHSSTNTDNIHEAKRLYSEQQTLIWSHRAAK